MHDPASLAAAVRSAEPLLLRYAEGFTDENKTRQAPNIANHFAWTMGHCALTMMRAADRIAGFVEPQTLPTGDWVHGDGTAGDPSRFDTESVGYGSTPVTDPAKYPRAARCVAIYKAAHEHLAVTIERSTASQLAKDVGWGKNLTMPAAHLALRMLFHNGTHCGQLIDLRRALGMAKVVG